MWHRFPAGFLWGAATSSHQVEGGNTHSDWWAAEASGRVPVASGDAVDHRRLWGADLDQLADAGLNAYRFSVEWARLEPEQGVWRDEEMDRYRAMVAGCRARGLEPMVTLYHFTLPQWVAARGGWRWRGAVPAFAAYAGRVAAALGASVTLYCVLNEPVVLALQSQLHGQWPPHGRSAWRAWRVAGRLLAAHRAARASVLRVQPEARLGVAKHMVHFRPLRPAHSGDRRMAVLVAWIFNHLWTRAARRHLDWLGVNYYTVMYCDSGLRLGRWQPQLVQARGGRQTEIGWEVHPDGLRRVLMVASRLGLPLYVTENGIASLDDGWRQTFLRRHLRAAARAVAAGADLRGYFHWSLLDNFEWAEGFAMHFGLVAVERESMERLARPSLAYLGGIARQNGVPRGAGVVDAPPPPALAGPAGAAPLAPPAEPGAQPPSGVDGPLSAKRASTRR